MNERFARIFAIVFGGLVIGNCTFGILIFVPTFAIALLGGPDINEILNSTWFTVLWWVLYVLFVLAGILFGYQSVKRLWSKTKNP